MIKELTYQINRQLKNLQKREMSEQDLSLDTLTYQYNLIVMTL